MNFRKIADRKKPDPQSNNLEEIYNIKEQIDTEDRIFEEELPKKYSLLQEFTPEDLKRLCDTVLGAGPPADEYADPKTGRALPLPQFKEDYIQHIVDELRLSEIRDFALRNRIISDSEFSS